MLAKLPSSDLASEALRRAVALSPARRSSVSGSASAARREKVNEGRQRSRSQRMRRLRSAGDVNFISQTQRERAMEEVVKRHRWELAAPSCLARELFVYLLHAERCDRGVALWVRVRVGKYQMVLDVPCCEN